MLGQAGAQRQGVEVFHQAVELADAPRMQAQQGFVQLGMQGQNFLEIGLGDAQNRAVAVGIGVVRAPVPVEDGDIAKPDARLHIGQGDLLARD